MHKSEANFQSNHKFYEENVFLEKEEPKEDFDENEEGTCT